MLYFIVSGYIPGTDIQLTFDMFLLFGITFAVMLSVFFLLRLAAIDTKQLVESIQNLDELSL